MEGQEKAKQASRQSKRYANTKAKDQKKKSEESHTQRKYKIKERSETDNNKKTNK